MIRALLTAGCALFLSFPVLAQLPEHIIDAVNAENRPEADRLRDQGRKPGEIMAFFGVEPGDTVAELMAASGYYISLLSNAVGEDGKVYALNDAWMNERFSRRGSSPLTERIEVGGLSNVEEVAAELEEPGFEPESLDAVFMVLFYHDTYWLETDRQAMNKAVFNALKPGGVYAIVDHAAQSGSGMRDVQTLHRVDEALVEEELTAAGFELVAVSDVLRNNTDDLSRMVFAQGLRGFTDRFVYKFVKPE